MILSKHFLFFVLMLVCISCIDVFDPKISAGKERLVVEAQITTKFDFQNVYLTFDAPFNSSQTNFKNLVKNAKVKIVDNEGRIFPFFDDLVPNNFIKTREGYNYRSVDKFKVELDKSYKLLIETSEGNTYESSFEKVIPVPKIEKVSFKFREIPPPTNIKGEYLVTVNLKDTPNQKNYYKWDWYHVKKINFCREWYIFGTGGAPTAPFIDRCCGECYEKVKCLDCLELANDKLIDGNLLLNKTIGKVPYDNATNYYMVVSQYSLSEGAYKFYNAVKEQSKNSGGLFDATPKSVKGNMKSVSNANLEILGYFGVSDVKEQIINLDRNVPGIKPIILQEYSDFFTITDKCYPCEELFNRSKVAPENWKF